MSQPSRAWPALDLVVFSAALLAYVAAVPLGLGRVEVASEVAAGIALDLGQQGAPLALLAMRVADYLPIGQVALRANLLSSLCCALAMAALARLAVDLVVPLRPPPSARQDARAFLCEPIAAGASALAAAFSLATFSAGVTAGSVAPTLLVLLGGLWVELLLLHDPGRRAAGLALACLAGLASAVGPLPGLVLWPVAVVLAAWALRKGARWPLFAPLCFVAAFGGFALASSAASSVPLSARDLFVSPFVLVPRSGVALRTTVTEIADQVGAVGVLLAAVGLLVLTTRSAAVAAWLGLNLVTATLLANLGASPGGAASLRAALPLAVAVTFALGGVGILHVSSRLGRARVAAALALAVIVVLSPAMDGGRSRWAGRAQPIRLLDRALDRAEVRSVVDPGTSEMAGLFRLARAIGLRPDLEIAPKPGR
jgi:hypothetical protein